MSQPSPSTKAPDERYLRALRYELLDDKELQQSAKLLGLDDEDYVEWVLFYVAQPELSPDLVVVDERDLAEQGLRLDVPTPKKLLQFLQDLMHAAASSVPLPPQQDGHDNSAAKVRRARSLIGQTAVGPKLAITDASRPAPRRDPNLRVSLDDNHERVAVEAAMARAGVLRSTGERVVQDTRSPKQRITDELEEIKQAYDAKQLKRSQYMRRRQELLVELKEHKDDAV